MQNSTRRIYRHLVTPLKPLPFFRRLIGLWLGVPLLCLSFSAHAETFVGDIPWPVRDRAWMDAEAHRSQTVNAEKATWRIHDRKWEKQNERFMQRENDKNSAFKKNEAHFRKMDDKSQQ